MAGVGETAREGEGRMGGRGRQEGGEGVRQVQGSLLKCSIDVKYNCMHNIMYTAHVNAMEEDEARLSELLSF